MLLKLIIDVVITLYSGMAKCEHFFDKGFTYKIKNWVIFNPKLNVINLITLVCKYVCKIKIKAMQILYLHCFI